VGAFIFNQAKGKAAQLALLPAANDGLIWVILANAGLESDAVLKDKVSLADIVSGTTDEATFTGYARLTHVGSVVVAIDESGDDVTIDDTTDPSWSPTSAQAIGKIVACYDPDTTGGTDADLIPIFADDFAMTTPVTGSITYQVATGGFYTAA
jgi:hypothetical protein